MLEPNQLDEKYHFLLRKLHSLTGIVPVGVFLCEHMLTNSLAWYGGPEEFNKSVHFLHALPWLPLLEFFGIFVPLAFHAIYGIVIALSGQSNVTSYRYWANRRYYMQRIAGYVTFVFIIIHLFKFRFAHWIGWGPEFMDPERIDKFEITRNGMLEWSIWGLAVPWWITFLMYVVGLAAACFHFANGIWCFCITWGIAITRKAQGRIGVVAALIGILLFVGGSLGLYGIKNPPTPREPVHECVIVERSATDTNVE